MRYSFVIPVYNRPDEVRELLESLTHQEFFDFEIVIIEDGSSVSSEPSSRAIVGASLLYAISLYPMEAPHEPVTSELVKPQANTLLSSTRMSSYPQAISLQ